MKKKLAVFLFAALLFVSAAVPAFAAGARVVDDADIFTPDEEGQLTEICDEISLRQSFDVVVVTTDDLQGWSFEAYADHYYDWNEYGFGPERDGALMLISMEPGNRACWISTCGYGIEAMSDEMIDAMLDYIVDGYLANGEYAEGAAAFATLCDRIVTQTRNAETDPYREESEYYDPEEILPVEPASLTTETVMLWVLFGVAIGLLAGVIRVSVMKGKMKTVRSQSAANEYVRGNSLNLTRSTDLFLYSTVSRIPRAQDNRSSFGGGGGTHSTHMSSSGMSHGGGGRRF